MAEGVVQERLLQDRSLPVGSANKRSVGWWGVIGLIGTEASLFAYLLFTYFYVTLNITTAWPPDGPPDFKLAAPNTVILIASSFTLWYGERSVKRRRTGMAVAMIALSIVLGSVFVFLQFKEWAGKGFGMSSHTYGSLFFTITGFHVAHVLCGLIVMAFLLLWTALGYFDEERHAAVSIGALYWHFVDVVWLFIFTSLYITPHLGLVHGQ